jgi:type IV pilus assembly protein PilA
MINALLKRRMENKKKNKKGFTLVELIVVLVIIAILAAVLVPTVSGYIGKAKKTAAQSALKNYITAASSAGTELLTQAEKVTAATNGPATFEASIIDLTADSTLAGLYEVTLDDATGTVVYAVYSDGTYYATYNNGTYETGKVSTKAITTLTTATPKEGEKVASGTAKDSIVIYYAADGKVS